MFQTTASALPYKKMTSLNRARQCLDPCPMSLCAVCRFQMIWLINRSDPKDFVQCDLYVSARRPNHVNVDRAGWTQQVRMS